METLNNVGKHSEHSSGHYEATVLDDGMVVLTTIFDDGKQTHKVRLKHGEWERLATWVAWAQADWHRTSQIVGKINV
jgi:hypothetical protein